MKKNIKKILIVMVLFISFLLVIPYKTVKADSGFDTDYGGSSWDGGGSWDSWDSGGSYGSYSRGYRNRPYTSDEIILIIVVVGVGTVLMIEVVVLLAKTRKPVQYNKLSNDKIYSIDPTIDIEKFKKYAYKTFVDIQEAWMNFDYDKLQTLLTDELYNTYKMQLSSLHIQEEKNIMKDFMLEDFGILDIKKTKTNQSVDILLSVSFKDYIINAKEEVVRGDRRRINHMTYKLTFIKTIDKKDNICPNCGGKLDQQASNKCPYCNSIVIADSYDYVLSRKEKLSQR